VAVYYLSFATYFGVKRLKIAISEDSDAKTAVYPFKVIQGYWFWCQSKARVHIPISDQ